MYCLIKQHAGLGDILYTLKIARTMIEQGYRVIWPVISQYTFISDYIKIENLVFVDENKPFPYKDIYLRGLPVAPSEDFIFIPIQIADQVYPHLPILGSKYALAGLDYKGWPDFVDIIRNKEKEETLYSEVLGLKDDEKYIFVNSIYGSPPNSKKLAGIDPNPEHKIVELFYIDGYNPFDWSLVLERASTIHTVDTCFICILEILETKTTDWNMYSRRRYKDFLYQIQPYFTNLWNYLDLTRV